MHETRGAPPPAGYALTTELTGREDALVALEGRASEAVNAFLFDDEAQSRRIRRFLLDRGAAEYAPPYVTVLVAPDGAAAGFYAVCPGGELAGRRLAGAVALARHGRDLVTPALTRRLQRASGAQARVESTDAYLARIAVDPAITGKGLGRWLLAHLLDDARDAGFARCVLDVAESNERARALYERAGFAEVGRGGAEDEESGRRVELLHLARSL